MGVPGEHQELIQPTSLDDDAIGFRAFRSTSTFHQRRSNDVHVFVMGIWPSSFLHRYVGDTRIERGWG
jgi:hypothetical protein